jgi:MFS family permease
MILWGIGMGAQRPLLKAIVGDMVSKQTRGSAYGISIPWLVGFSVIAQLCSIPFIFIV